ncbi:MAG: protein-methionine-sulfoxide reductase heme-binding subunit MsrQ [Rhodomicrobium sp.]|nr:protein-methionine-sulfoxide reductase heme-binding subunit MsrQ [Rhodomicrobium sp.]
MAWQSVIRPAIYWAGLIPAVWGFYLGFTDQLGPEPIKALEHHLGIWALRFLIAGLAITPLRRFGGPSLIPYRRAIGLLAFIYTLLHLTVYVWFDQGFDLAAIWGDILKRPYITIGILAFLILVPLAATSNNAMIERLGASAWQKLHRWVYLAAALGALHFLLLVKSWPPEPIVYCAILAALLLIRLIPARRGRRKRASGG